jgi:hypothetical protein
VDEGTLGVHEVKLVVKARPGLSNGCGVAKHGNASVDGGKFAAGDADRPRDNQYIVMADWRLMDYSLGIVDTELEASRAPFNEVERGLRLESSSGGGAVPRNDIATVQKSNSHILSIARVADNHLVVGLKACSD